MSTSNIIYEQPLNEHIRFCLRLEHLFAQVAYHLPKESEWDTRAALTAILEILSISDRPDLKNKLCQALSQCNTSLSQLENAPNINRQKLFATISEFDTQIDALRNSQKRIGQDLRENEFLNAIQQRLYTPAGTCCFSAPAFYLWLQKPPEMRKHYLEGWFKHFEQLQKIIDLLLKLARESTSLKMTTTQNNFYQANLDPQLSYQMIRIAIPKTLQLFPEISVGRHRLTIHFFKLTELGKSTQIQNDINFELACCKL